MAAIPYRLTAVKTVRTIDVEGGAPDTEYAEASGTRVVVIRPRRLELVSSNADPATTVTSAAIEGRVVRKRDNELGPTKQGSWFAGRHWHDDLPAWIAEILKAEGLEFGE